jgi:urocanate hydratase
MDGARPVRAPRGTTLTARSWATEAPLRMLQNNLDPEVAERPDDLVVYGGTGRAARDWRSFDAMVRTLTDLREDETMLVPSGKPVGVPAHPRVGAAGADRQLQPRRRLVHLARVPPPGAARADHVRPDDRRLVDIHRDPGHPAGHLRDVRRRRRQALRPAPSPAPDRDRRIAAAWAAPSRSRSPSTAGCAWSSTWTRPGCAAASRHRYLDELADSLDEAVRLCTEAKAGRRALSVGVVGNCASVLPELLRRGVEVDIVTDRPRPTTRCPTCPRASTSTTGRTYAARKPEEFTDRARASMAKHVEAMVGYQDAGAEVFDYGNSLRDEARQGGYDRAFAFPGFVPAYIRPLFCEGRGPFRWVALSGDPADIHATDRAVLDLFPDDDPLHRWIRAAGERVAFQGLPARICWLGQGERDKAGLRFNEMVASGEVSAPVVIGRDHLDTGSVASPYRETEAMADGSDAIADWPLLNALVSTSSGASWVSIHHGGGVGIGRSIHAGQVSVADGTELAAAKLARVLSNDPATGVLRHVDAGYDTAADTAAAHDIRIPMREAP